MKRNSSRNFNKENIIRKFVKYTLIRLHDTMGTCVLDWVVDGHSALLLGIAPGDCGVLYNI